MFRLDGRGVRSGRDREGGHRFSGEYCDRWSSSSEKEEGGGWGLGERVRLMQGHFTPRWFVA